jgi:hypothetical protein
METAHSAWRVKGAALVTREPLCDSCTSVVAPAARVGRYTSRLQLMHRRTILQRPTLGFLGGPRYVS